MITDERAALPEDAPSRTLPNTDFEAVVGTDGESYYNANRFHKSRLADAWRFCKSAKLTDFHA